MRKKGKKTLHKEDERSVDWLYGMASLDVIRQVGKALTTLL